MKSRSGALVNSLGQGGQLSFIKRIYEYAGVRRLDVLDYSKHFGYDITRYYPLDHVRTAYNT